MTAMNSKVVPIRKEFTTLSAMLHCFASDPEIDGFVGVLIRKDGSYMPVTFGVDSAELALAGAMLSRMSTEEDL